MNGITAIRNLAERNHFGHGSFTLKSGVSVEILSNPKTELFHVFQLENNQIIKAEGGKGYHAMSEIIDEYKSVTTFPDDVLKAFGHSFNVRI